MSSFSNDLQNIRESYYSLSIGPRQDGYQEPVWVKKLRNILENDIHEKSLGCHIQDTHIQIGSGLVHMNSFFEAQILFSHAKWVSRFKNWLETQLQHMLDEGCLIIGYDTYIEPLLSHIKSSNSKLEYCIYEDHRYVQNGLAAGARLRYFKEIFNESKTIKHIVYLCGISSTLSTFEKMRMAFQREAENIFSSASALNYKDESYYSIVQVLAKSESQNQDFFCLGDRDRLRWDRMKKNVYRECGEEELFHIHYLVDVETVWDLAEKCRWCFPENFLDERPLVITDSSSVIPMQQIGAPSANRQSGEYSTHPSEGETTRKQVHSDGVKLFFRKNREKTEFLTPQYLYYSHIVRGTHHFRYYIRTNTLFGNIMRKSAFQNYCQQIRDSIQTWETEQSMQRVLRILIAPFHFSNNRFPHEINRLVFDNTAHEISFDPGREYRSNFETKYSNYAYILEQIHQTNQENNATHICFYYVDDEIITGETFYRAKSFVSSLLYQYAGGDSDLLKRCEVFSAVFTLIDRTGASDKRSFVASTKKFFPFIQFSAPAMGNYGNPCPICQEIEESGKIAKNCCLSSTELYWREKERHLRCRTLAQARQEVQFQSKHLGQRYFTRFYCENKLCEASENCWSEREILERYILTVIKEIKLLSIEQQYEFLISFLKAMSRPVLYYKENGKKAAMRILLTVLSVYLEASTDWLLTPAFLVKESAKKLSIKLTTSMNQITENTNTPDDEKYKRLRYQLLCMLLSCLSNIGSNYLIGGDHIIQLCDYVERVNKNYCRFSSSENFRDDGLPGFYTLLVNYFKRLICGVSGREKSIYAKSMLSQLLRSNHPDPERRKLYQVLYLENIQFSHEDEQIEKSIVRKNNQNTIRKYLEIGDVLKAISPGITCTFFADFREQLVELAESLQLDNSIQNFLAGSESELQRMGYCIPKGDKRSFWVMFQAKEPNKSLREERPPSPRSQQDISKVYLRIQFPTQSFNNFDVVQKILIQRRSILQIIQADIATGALNAAIQAKAAEVILLTDKTQSHGTSKDINRFYLLVQERFSDAKKRPGLDKSAWCHAYNALNLFMNRCIAAGATKFVLEKIFSSAPSIQSFGRYVCLCERDNRGCDYLDTYLNMLTDNSHVYLTRMIEDLKTKKGDNALSGECNIEIVIDEKSRKNFSALKFFPSLINITNDSIESQDHIIQLIGILDIFIRNAIEHTGKVCKIQIICETGDKFVPEDKLEYADYSSSYRIIVRNTMTETVKATPTEIGFTKLFFTEYLDKFSKHEPRRFAIKMEETSEHMFDATFLCFAPEMVIKEAK